MLIKVKNLDKFVEGFKSKKWTLEDASKSLFKDKQSILKILPYDTTGALYNYLPKKLQKDESFVKELTELNGRLFLKAKRYQKNNELALSAIKTCPDAAAFLNFNKDNGVELAVKAVQNNPFAQRHLRQYAEHENVIVSALSSEGILYRYLSKQSQSNEAYAALALQTSPFIYRFMPKPLKSNAQLASIAIEADKGYAYSIYKEQVADEVRENPHVAVLAISKNLNSMLNVPSQTFRSEEFLSLFKEYLDNSKQGFEQNDDQEGLLSFQASVNSLFVQKSQRVLQDSINNLLIQKQQLQESFDGDISELLNQIATTAQEEFATEQEISPDGQEFASTYQGEQE